jgi:hypothetical protein
LRKVVFAFASWESARNSQLTGSILFGVMDGYSVAATLAGFQIVPACHFEEIATLSPHVSSRQRRARLSLPVLLRTSNTEF